MYNQILQFENLKNHLNEILNFIELLKLQKKEITNVNLSNNFRQAIIKNINSQINYNAIIISIYSAFENFIDNIIESYCKFILENTTSFDRLPKTIINFYFYNIGDFLKSPNRYNTNKNYKNIILESNNLIIDIKNNSLDFDFILRHSGNLKFSKVEEFFKNIGIKNISESIKNNYLFQNIISNLEGYEFNDIPNKYNFFKYLDNLVEERNKIAHSWDIQNRISIDDLSNKIIPFISTICNCILEIVILESFKYLYIQNKLISIGETLKIFRKNILGFKTNNIKLNINSYMLLKNKKNNFNIAKIEDMEINGKKVDQINIENIEATIKLSKNIKKSYSFFTTII